MRNIVTKLFGFTATLIHGDFLTMDRWLWIRKHLMPLSRGRLIDVGCGSGAFSIGAGRMGFEALGLSWNQHDMEKARERARICKLDSVVNFEVQDARFLGDRGDLKNTFNVAICTETIEHILNDSKLVSAISSVLTENGVLLLTTPNYYYRPIDRGDSKENVSLVEDGGHVRIGYTPADCQRVCEDAGLVVVQIEYCSGFLSQKMTALLRSLNRVVGFYPAWIITLPLRVFPVLLDGMIDRLSHWPGYSICLVARKIGTRS